MPFLPETHEADVHEWARALAERSAIVLHTGLGLVGIASRFWPPGTYVDPNGLTISSAVLTLADGNSFLVDAETPNTLTEDEAATFDTLVDQMNALVLGAAMRLRETSKPERLPIALSILVAALTAQLRALRSGGA